MKIHVDIKIIRRKEAMKRAGIGLMCSFAVFAACCLMASVAAGFEYPNPKTYFPGGAYQTIAKHKNWKDDPRPLLTTLGPKQVLPKEFYAKLVYDVEKMKKDWAAIVGFKAPEVVGKVAPHIKPGKYTYKDVQKDAGFKELLIPLQYERMAPGAPPFCGNMSQFEIIPTRQYYWNTPVAEMTRANQGKAKLDDKGYLVQASWQGGYPFPKPSGKFKAQQVIYNMEKRYLGWGGSYVLWNHGIGVTKNHAIDHWGGHEVRYAMLAGRSGEIGPKGWYDKRAQERGESRTYLFSFAYPRDMAGLTTYLLTYLDPNKKDSMMAYVPSLRRVRKLTSTDTQDAVGGLDLIYDDNEGFFQKISPTVYPYKYELIGEREYLIPAASIDGAEYVSEKDKWEIRNVRFERRPVYVVQMTQQDPNYVYSKRIFYIDKETFLFYHVENYDQKGRLYRTFDITYGWYPEMGTFAWSAYNHERDYVDKHSMFIKSYALPALWDRRDLSIEAFSKAK